LVVDFVVVFDEVEVVAVVPVAAVPVVPLVDDIAPPVPVVSVDIVLVVLVIVLPVPVVSVDIVPVVPVIEVSVDIVVELLDVEELSVATAPVSVTLLLFTSLLQAKPKTVRARMVMRIRVFFICRSSQMVACESVAAT
jgi:hypothetical protein